jgi:hypothetical protein
MLQRRGASCLQQQRPWTSPNLKVLPNSERLTQGCPPARKTRPSEERKEWPCRTQSLWFTDQLKSSEFALWAGIGVEEAVLTVAVAAGYRTQTRKRSRSDSTFRIVQGRSIHKIPVTDCSSSNKHLIWLKSCPPPRAVSAQSRYQMRSSWPESNPKWVLSGARLRHRSLYPCRFPPVV